MRNLLLVLWSIWQGITSPFYPDPKVEVEAAQNWLDVNVKLGDRLAPQLLEAARAANFKHSRLNSDAKRQLLMEAPWQKLPVNEIYVLEKAIPFRPTIGVTAVRAFLALDKRDRIIHRDITVFRTFL